MPALFVLEIASSSPAHQIRIIHDLMEAPPVKLMSKYPKKDPFHGGYLQRSEGDEGAAYLKSLFELHVGEVQSCPVVWEKGDHGQWVKKARVWNLARLLETNGPAFDLEGIFFTYCLMNIPRSRGATIQNPIWKVIIASITTMATCTAGREMKVLLI